MSGKTKNGARTQTRANRTDGERDGIANALRFEQEKNQVLLDEVISLEDALVNRQMEEFDAVISDDTREFWREQLLANRDKAEGALKEMVRSRVSGVEGEQEATRRPLHNRATARPVRPGDRDSGGGMAEGNAVKIRNRAHELCKREGIPFSTAFRRAEREVSEA